VHSSRVKENRPDAARLFLSLPKDLRLSGGGFFLVPLCSRISEHAALILRALYLAQNLDKQHLRAAHRRDDPEHEHEDQPVPAAGMPEHQQNPGNEQPEIAHRTAVVSLSSLTIRMKYHIINY